MRISLGSTSTRTFLVWPGLVAVEQAVVRRPVRLRYVPLLPAGFLLYLLAGRYRTDRGGGGPGMSQPPERLVTSGVYALSRNPMYLGHLTFLGGLALATRSPLAGVLLAAHIPWFGRRVQRDEEALAQRFGERYGDYCVRVPRWIAVTMLVERPM